MQFSFPKTVAAALAFSSSAIATITGPFYITIVPEDGSASYPATIATVSRGAQILSSALEYEQEFTFNVTSGRLYKAEETTALGSGALNVGAPLLFAQTSGAALTQVTVDDAVYLVQANTSDIYQWWSAPTTTGLAVQVNFEGVGSDDANAAIRIDVEAA
ncbi:hypothetical protein KJ359_006743 [Pestalotiopsis sp. 9143b]|nr:hypothetical protein KJ359_006743 [Pestalotiopsis sp. 9143b]